MINPTVGRQVWYWPFIGQMDCVPHGQPFTATITHVINSTTVNLVALTETGNPLRMTSITLAQGRPARTGECFWVPVPEQECAASPHCQD